MDDRSLKHSPSEAGVRSWDAINPAITKLLSARDCSMVDSVDTYSKQ